MAKLYPPVIEGTIPAFNGTVLTVPFSMNRSVSKNDISGFALKVKTVQSNTWIATLKGTWSKNGQIAATFNIDESDWNPAPGQYYKVQLAYINSGTVGYFSTVGVVKYTDISNLDLTLQYRNTAMNNAATTYQFMHDYLVAYNYAKDPMEKIYNYRFTISNEAEVILYDSGWQLHNAVDDSATYVSTDAYTFIDDLDEGEVYYLQYQAITVNGLELSTPKYKIIMPEEQVSPSRMTFLAKNNYENGYVALMPQGAGYDPQDKDAEAYISGQFRIYRCNMNTPKRWEPIFVFVLQQEQPSLKVAELKDFTVAHGETYKYKICQFNDAGIIATSAYSNEVYVDFEDMFLFDGQRQLKVQYNPKVSSFKNDILESKIDTIGSKYPFFFRNGVVNYKEFPISGLISYWMDDEELFKPYSEMGITTTNDTSLREGTSSGDQANFAQTPKWTSNDLGKGTLYKYNKFYKTTDLVNYNIAAERQFKLDVLEWLTNGQPKLFRSPTEGNYIVRLLNTSLTPNDTLGRMLHTFNCTAYEIDDMTYDNLNNYGFIHNDLDVVETQILRFRTINLVELYNNLDNTNHELDETDGSIELLINPQNGSAITAQSVLIEDCEYGDMFSIDNKPIMIGATQTYNLNNLHPIASIKFYPSKLAAIGRTVEPFADVDNAPQVTYSYYDGFTGISLFDQVTDLAYEVIPANQFTRSSADWNKDIISEIEDIKTSIVKYYDVIFEQRPVEEIYSSAKWSELQGKTSISENFIKNTCTLDLTASGNGDKTLKFMKGAPFYIYHINPVPNEQIIASKSGYVTNYTFAYYDIDIMYGDDYELSNDEDYYTKDDDGNYIKYTGAEKSEGVKIYIRKIVDTNEASYADGLEDIYYTIRVPEEAYQDMYLSWDGNKFSVLNNYSTRVYMNTGESPELSAAKKIALDEAGDYIDVAVSPQPVLYRDLDFIHDLYIGTGVLATLGYQTVITTYAFEAEGSISKKKRNASKKTGYLDYIDAAAQARANYDKGSSAVYSLDPDSVIIKSNKTYPQLIASSYKSFITALETRIAEWNKENG